MALFHVPRADHMIRHHQELLAGQPAVVTIDGTGEFLNGASAMIAGQQQIEHGHEMAFAGAERAVQVGGRTAAALHCDLDEAERVIERTDELRRDHVAGNGDGGGFVADAFAALSHLVDDIAQESDQNVRPRVRAEAAISSRDYLAVLAER
jgi:hypothetical protein